MRTIRAVLSRISSLWRRRARERDFSAELESHIEMHIADNVGAGMSPDEARRNALVALGGLQQTKERYRDRRGTAVVEQFILDLRFAVRMLTRDRGFAATVVVVLGVGIAVTNTFLILTYAICLRGLPIDSPERVLFIRARDAADRTLGMSSDDFNDLRASSNNFAAMAAFTGGPMALGDNSRAAERFRGAYVSSDTFRLLGELPLAGRDFEPQDDQPGLPSVVILGRSVWMSRYSGDPSIVGSTIRINGVPSSVIGIMPDRSKYPNDAEVWQPLAALSEVAREKRDTRTLAMMARLDDGITLAAARAELTSIWSRLAKAHPDTNGNVRLEVIPVNRQYAGDINHPAWFAFLTAGFLVLIVACANVANLLLMRGVHRIRELAIRGSLGATRPRIIRQLLTESVLLSALGGMFGIALALIGARLLWSLHPAGILPYWMHFSMDGPVLALVVAVCLTTSLIFGSVPYQVTRGNASLALNAARRGATRGLSSRRWTSAFLVVQFAVGLTFLGSISVAARLLDTQDRRDPYIEASTLLTVSIALPPQRYSTPRDRAAFYDTLRDRLTSVPALESIAVASELPLGGAQSRQLFLEGTPAQTTGPRPTAWTVIISPSYFETLGLGLLRGRAFHERDGLPGQQNVIVNQRFVDVYFAKEDPIGKRISLAGSGGAVSSWHTIVGVAPSVRQRPGPVPDPIVYLPFRANADAQFSLVVRRQDPMSIVPVLREQIRSIDADVPLFSLMTLAHAMRDANWNNRLSSLMANLVTILAVLLSAVGLYALISHAVAQLTPEIGIRVAMGAAPHQVAWTVVRRGLIQLAMGVAAGIVFAVASSSVFSSGSPSSGRAGELFIAALILVIVSLVAMILPTLRAIRVSPAVALRYE